MTIHFMKEGVYGRKSEATVSTEEAMNATFTAVRNRSCREAFVCSTGTGVPQRKQLVSSFRSVPLQLAHLVIAAPHLLVVTASLSWNASGRYR